MNLGGLPVVVDTLNDARKRSVGEEDQLAWLDLLREREVAGPTSCPASNKLIVHDDFKKRASVEHQGLLHLSDANLRPLKVEENRHRLLDFDGGAPHIRDFRPNRSGVAVAAVDATDVHAGLEELLQHTRLSGSWTKGGDDFGFACGHRTKFGWRRV